MEIRSPIPDLQIEIEKALHSSIFVNRCSLSILLTRFTEAIIGEFNCITDFAFQVFHLFCFSDFTGSSWVLMEKLSVYTSERQFSGISDSKASFVPDTESLYSDDDLQNKDHIDDDQSLEPELDFEKDQEQEELIELVS
ncbi:hypothetical protein L1887_19337 [Cichorium endivia]|nr:hypothetical protein L1887_19337 [Cichorium endivia]